MPTFVRDDGVPIVTFDPGLELSPFTLFKRLRAGREVRLVDVRPRSDRRRTLAGAEHRPDPSWTPDSLDAACVLFDDDGSLAITAARRLHEAGFAGVRALFGGLDLYEFSLDPEIVGAETFLVLDA